MLSILQEKAADTAKAFRKALAAAQDGDEILLYQGKDPCDDFGVHPDGFVISIDDKILLNGTMPLAEVADTDDEWVVHPDGAVIRRGHELLLNGKERLYEGDFDDWGTHPSGFIIERDNKLLLNGTQVLYQGSFDEFFEWECNPCFPAFLIKRKDGLLLNGRQRVAADVKGPGCAVHPDGIVLSTNGGILLPDGTMIATKGIRRWGVHRHGIIVSKKRRDRTEIRLLVRKTFDADEVIV